MVHSIDVLNLIKTRRSIRRYRSDPVPEELIEQVLEAARWAPSSTNAQPWEFVVVREPAIRKAVADLCHFFFVPNRHVAEAPVLIALVGWPDRAQFYREDVTLASANILLMAHALGLGCCWIGAVDYEGVSRILKLPQEARLMGVITMGWPDEQPQPRPRRPLAELVHYDVYGNRAPGAVVQPGRLGLSIVIRILRRLRVWFGHD